MKTLIIAGFYTVENKVTNYYLSLVGIYGTNISYINDFVFLDSNYYKVETLCRFQFARFFDCSTDNIISLFLIKNWEHEMSETKKSF
jgi:hypothetical protein